MARTRKTVPVFFPIEPIVHPRHCFLNKRTQTKLTIIARSLLAVHPQINCINLSIVSLRNRMSIPKNTEKQKFAIEGNRGCPHPKKGHASESSRRRSMNQKGRGRNEYQFALVINLSSSAEAKRPS
jgi:hypothetical protein